MTKLDRLFLRLEKDGFTVRKSELCNIDCTGINAPPPCGVFLYKEV